VYVLTCLACLPTLALAIAAGALWGVGWGLLYVWCGIVLGSSAAFLLGRYLVRDQVLRRLRKHPRLWAIEEAVSAEDWKIVILARLALGSPFFLLNYLFGLTRIGFWTHLWATAVGVLPSAFLLVYLGSVGEMAVRGRFRTPWDWMVFVLGWVALAGAIVLVARRTRRILDTLLSRGDGPGSSRPAKPEDPEPPARPN